MYHHFSEFYNDLFPQDPELKTFIKGFIKPNYNAIDLGSGTGRLTKMIDELGMNVIGIDLDPSMVSIATKNYPELDFRVDDMVNALKENHQYELMTCFGNTLVHLNQSQLRIFFEEVQKNLSPSGYLIVQTINYLRVLKEKPAELKVLKHKQIVFNRYYEYFDDHILFTTKLSINNQETIESTKLYPYTIDYFTSLFKGLGLKYQYFGDFQLKPFQDTDYYLLMVITQS